MKTSSAISFKAKKYVTLQQGGVGGEKKVLFFWDILKIHLLMFLHLIVGS